MRRLNISYLHCLGALILIGFILRFYNLTWGAPYFFHPDERNIASSVSQLHFPDQLNPRFFAYGGFSIYLVFLTGILMKFVQNLDLFFSNKHLIGNVSFEDAIIISRFYSSVLSTLIIPLIFIIGRKISGNIGGIIASFLATFSIGFIQFAHFGTVETLQTIILLVIFLLSINIIQNFSKRTFFLLSIFSGILLGTKISNAAFLPLPLFAFYLSYLSPNYLNINFLIKKIPLLLLGTFSFLSVVFLVYLISNPFVFLDFSSFKSSMDYESGVALGTLPVFYTGEFIQTNPIIYQIFRVLPFLITPFLTVLFILSFPLLILLTIKKRNPFFGLLFLFFTISFFSQAFFYVKWIRYSVSSIPFIIFFVSIVFSYIYQMMINRKYIYKKVFLTFSFAFLGLYTIFAVSFFITTYIEKDTRLQALSYALENINPDARILSEVYDLGITPFNPYFRSIDLYNFYELDNSNPEYSYDTFLHEVKGYQYIIIPSQRIVKTRLQHEEAFPAGNKVYKNLFSETIGFNLVYETPCSVWCKITYFSNPVWSYESTANVFDRPTVYVFKNTSR